MARLDYIMIDDVRYLRLSSVINWLDDYRARLEEAGGLTYPLDNAIAALLEVEVRCER